MAATTFHHPFKFAGNHDSPADGSRWAGYRHKDPLSYRKGYHIGTDYNGAGNDYGMVIKNIGEGRVIAILKGDNYGFGNTVIVKHLLSPKLALKFKSLYIYSIHCHLSSFAKGLAVGKMYKIDAPLGRVGKTGGAEAPHDHLMIKRTPGGWFNYPVSSKIVITALYLNPYRVCQDN